MPHSIMKSRGRRALGSELNLKWPIVFFLCFCFFLVGLFGSIIITQDLNRGGSMQKFLHDFRHEEDDFMVPGESGESSVSSIPCQVTYIDLFLEEGKCIEVFSSFVIKETSGNFGKNNFQSVNLTIVTVLSWRPRAVHYPNFATDEQCQHIIKLAMRKLKPSSLALRKGETTESTKGIRTSSGAFISASEDSTKVLDFVEQKIARATMIPKSHGEAFNVLRYEIGQRYVSHYDAFNPAEYGPIKSQRVASFLLYLSDVEEGGETMFPFENGSNMNTGYDYQRCIGLKVRPRRGDGLLFYSLFPNGTTIDPTSLHGSCPVVKGEKWVATKWIRSDEQKE